MTDREGFIPDFGLSLNFSMERLVCRYFSINIGASHHQYIRLGDFISSQGSIDYFQMSYYLYLENCLDLELVFDAYSMPTG